MNNLAIARTEARVTQASLPTLKLTPGAVYSEISLRLAVQIRAAAWPTTNSVRYWHPHKAALGLPIPVTRGVVATAMHRFSEEPAVTSLRGPSNRVDVLATAVWTVQPDFIVTASHIPPGFELMGITTRRFAVLVEDRSIRSIPRDVLDECLAALRTATGMPTLVLPELYVGHRASEFFTRATAA